MNNTNEVFLLVTAGTGPQECALAVAKLLPVIQREARARGLKAIVRNCQPGLHLKTYTSAVIQVTGEDPMPFCTGWLGTIKWECQSPYRPKHKRKTWYVAVYEHKQTDQNYTIVNSDLQIESMRASGPGGQHVNKTNSAVRLTHKPTGLTAISQKHRSWHLNKKEALETLKAKLSVISEQNLANQLQSGWQAHQELERGNAIKVFKGTDFKLLRS